MEIDDRIWSGDTEVVFETARGYEWFFGELIGCFGEFGIEDLTEIWHRPERGDPLIELRFRYAGDRHHLWLERRSDVLDSRLLEVFNAILDGPWRFEWSHTPDGVEVRRVAR